MEMTQLSRPQTTATQKSEKTGGNHQDQVSNGAGFDKHLSRQIDHAEARKSTREVKNTEEYQEDNEVVVAQESDSAEAERVADEPMALDMPLEVDARSAALAIDESVVADTDNSVDSPLPSMPSAGNDLPSVDVSGQPLPVQSSMIPVVEIPLVQSVATQKTTADVVLPQQLDVAKLTPSNLNPVQVVVEESNKFNHAEEFVAPEFKLQMKVEGQNTVQNIPNKVALTVASAATLASNLQQVPVTTSLASINTPSATAMGESPFSNLSTLGSGISTPVQNPAWSNSLAERINWMVNGNFQNAELKLNPAHLGPLEIKLAINDDQASVSFVTAHAPVRDALDMAMPRLREMLEQQGLNLADVDVSQYSDAESEQADKSSDQGLDIDAELAGSDAISDQMKESTISVDVNSGVSIYA